jgi:hypothetical protein
MSETIKYLYNKEGLNTGWYSIEIKFVMCTHVRLKIIRYTFHSQFCTLRILSVIKQKPEHCVKLSHISLVYQNWKLSSTEATVPRIPDSVNEQRLSPLVDISGYATSFAELRTRIL